MNSTERIEPTGPKWIDPTSGTINPGKPPECQTRKDAAIICTVSRNSGEIERISSMKPTTATHSPVKMKTISGLSANKKHATRYSVIDTTTTTIPPPRGT